jgi:hypothetical protein
LHHRHHETLLTLDEVFHSLKFVLVILYTLPTM